MQDKQAKEGHPNEAHKVYDAPVRDLKVGMQKNQIKYWQVNELCRDYLRILEKKIALKFVIGLKSTIKSI